MYVMSSVVTPILLSSSITIFVIAIIYYTGKKQNTTTRNRLKSQISHEFSEIISEFSEEQKGGAEWFFKGTVRSGFPMKNLDIVISLARKHLVIPRLAARIFGTTEIVIIEGDFKRRSRMALEILHKKEQKAITKYRQYFRTLENVNVTNPELANTYMIKSNNPDLATTTLRHKDVEQALLAVESSLYWASIETDTPHLRIAFTMNPSFSIADVVNITTTLVKRYDQVLRKAETRR